MERKYHNSFDYLGAALNDNDVLVTDAAKDVYLDLKVEAERVANTPYEFSRGNIFEFIEGSKVELANLKAGHTLKVSPVNASFERKQYQTPEDISYEDADGNLIIAQAKVSRDTDWLIDNLSKEKYLGQQRWCPSDMYDSIKEKLSNKEVLGIITPEEKDTLDHLVRCNTSNDELDLLRGEDGKVDLDSINSYIEGQQNKLFLDECANFTTGVTLSSALFGLAFSSAQNLYSYYKGNQNIGAAVKNIGKDTLKSSGHGFVASSIGNCFKYIGYESGNAFLRNGINDLVIANGTIDLCKSAYYFKQGKISLNDLVHNIVGSSALTIVNLGINYLIPGASLIKLCTSIVLHRLIAGFMHHPKEQSILPMESEQTISVSLNDNINKLNLQLEEEMANDKKLFDTIKSVVSTNKFDLDEITLKSLLHSLDIDDAYDTYENFLSDLHEHKIIKIKF